MAKRYYLRCECGKKLILDVGQAGQTLTCECGRVVEAPTFRGLGELEQVVEVDAPASASSSWGLGQGMTFLGLVVLVAALAWAMYLTFDTQRGIAQLPDPYANYMQDFSELSAPVSWQAWRSLREGLPENENQPVVQIAENNARWWWVAIGVSALGGAIAVGGVGVMYSTGGAGKRRRS